MDKRLFHILMLPVLVGLATAGGARGVTIDIDYSYDTSNFFGAGNPAGSTAGTQARLALEAAADFYSGILNDTLAAIAVPPPFHSGPFDGEVTWSWTLRFGHPSAPGSDTMVTLVDQYIPADEFRIFVGAKGLPSNTLGTVTGIAWFPDVESTCCFSDGEIQQLNSIQAAFDAAVSRRGEPQGQFAPWGGAISFDNDGSVNWHFPHDLPLPAGKSDFYSVALHEIGHSLGIGFGDAWSDMVSNGRFTGSDAVAEYGGTVPLRCVSGHCDHWAEGTQSATYQTGTTQEALLDPTLTTGQRKRLTLLDAAALADLGWEVAPPPEPPALAGDYNGDDRVTAADYVVWRNTFGDVGAGLAADGNHNNQVDQGDYTTWRNNFGAVGSGGTSAVVPEPSTAGLATLMLVSLLARRFLRPGVAKRCRAVEHRSPGP